MLNPPRRSSFLGTFTLLFLVSCDGPLRLVVVEATSGPPEAAMAGSSVVGGTGAGGVVVDDGSISAGAMSGGSAALPRSEGGAAGDGSGGAAGAPSGVPFDREPLFVASYVSHAYPGQYMRYQGEQGVVSFIDVAAVSAPLGEAQQSASFEVIPGLHDEKCISFRALTEKKFLRHSGSRVYLHAPDDARLFLADATYCVESGLADKAGFSFRSINYPDRFIRVRAPNELWTDDFVDTAAFASESTFYRETAFSARASR